MQIGELFQKAAVGGFTRLNAALHGRQFAFAKVESVLRLIMPVEQGLFLRFQLGQGHVLVARISLSLFLDLLYAFFNLRDPERDFFLFLLELLECDDFSAQLGEIRRLRSAFASEIYLAFLEEPLLVPQRHARSLALNLQCDFAEACADETHENEAT